ncbi:MAG: hypothetical protein R3C09_22405 [Pirellulaceae bacterium]
MKKEIPADFDSKAVSLLTKTPNIPIVWGEPVKLLGGLCRDQNET